MATRPATKGIHSTLWVRDLFAQLNDLALQLCVLVQKHKYQPLEFSRARDHRCRSRAVAFPLKLTAVWRLYPNYLCHTTYQLASAKANAAESASVISSYKGLASFGIGVEPSRLVMGRRGDVRCVFQNLRMLASVGKQPRVVPMQVQLTQLRMPSAGIEAGPPSWRQMVRSLVKSPQARRDKTGSGGSRPGPETRRPESRGSRLARRPPPMASAS